MMNVVGDTAILAVNRSKNGNFADFIVCRDNFNRRHVIDLQTCAANFKEEHPDSSGRCIGERNLVEHYFILYTTGTKTKFVFARIYVCNIFQASPFKRQ